jgi:hypothetical protein
MHGIQLKHASAILIQHDFHRDLARQKNIAAPMVAAILWHFMVVQMNFFLNIRNILSTNQRHKITEIRHLTENFHPRHVQEAKPFVTDLHARHHTIYKDFSESVTYSIYQTLLTA